MTDTTEFKCKNCKDHGVIGGMYRVGAADVDVWEEPCPDCGLSDELEQQLAYRCLGYLGESATYCLATAENDPTIEISLTRKLDTNSQEDLYPVYGNSVRELLVKLETERDAARQHAAEARIRENKAEDARITASDKATKLELEVEELKKALEAAEARATAAEKDKAEIEDINNEALEYLVSLHVARRKLGHEDIDTLEVLKLYDELRTENERLRQLVSMAEAFTITDDSKRRTHGYDHIEVVHRGDNLWCVSNGSSVLNKNGEWEWEPQPSSRTDEFIASSRFSLDEALARGFEAIANDPLKRSIPRSGNELPLPAWNTFVTYQKRVGAWLEDCFGHRIAHDKIERIDRFMEEAIELAQSLGYSADRAHALVEYVFSRDIGEPNQELGGTIVTLASLSYAHGLSMAEAGETELRRISQPEIKEKIRAKQKTKPTGSALPIPVN
ncbi:hypothetical protein [Mesorhizobium sp. SP-1A]|uniref:hypothetical protein n=1 Tax=Mesorhizobium sp. SP-1A TaxID=3077840 RepID=UPI0028F72EA9|nr:hypothetical protein [Mesorhizobium sp. SP-1A]